MELAAKQKKRLEATSSAPGEEKPTVVMTHKEISETNRAALWRDYSSLITSDLVKLQQFGILNTNEVRDLVGAAENALLQHPFLVEAQRQIVDELTVAVDALGRPLLDGYHAPRYQGSAGRSDELPRGLRRTDVGKYWISPPHAYVWVGDRFRVVRIDGAREPSRDAHFPPGLTLYDSDGAAAKVITWGGDVVSSLTPAQRNPGGRPPPPPIQWEATESVQRRQVFGVGGGVIVRGVTGFDWTWWRVQIGLAGLMVVHLILTALLVWGVATGDLVGGWWITWAGLVANPIAIGWQGGRLVRRTVIRRREIAGASETSAVEPERIQENPRPLQWETREFAAACECPNCGWIDAHLIREPDQPDDPADATVIRQCSQCNQEWGEK